MVLVDRPRAIYLPRVKRTCSRRRAGGLAAARVSTLLSGFRVQGAGFRVQGAGFRVQGSGFIHHFYHLLFTSIMCAHFLCLRIFCLVPGFAAMTCLHQGWEVGLCRVSGSRIRNIIRPPAGGREALLQRVDRPCFALWDSGFLY